MVDPVQQNQAQRLSQLAQRGGLQQLLSSGRPLEGQVMQSRPDGKVDVQFMGRTFTLDSQGLSLKQGQAVLARLLDGQILLQPGSTGAAQSGTSPNLTSLGSLLQQAGIQSPQAMLIAQAMIGAGIPFDKTVIRELATILPKVLPGELGALSFLMSRGLPITSNMAGWVSRLLANRSRLGNSIERISESLRDINSDSLHDEENPDEIKQRIEEIESTHDNLRQQIRKQTPEGELDEEGIEELIRSVLASPEALLRQGNDSPQSTGEAVVRLLTLLLELREQVQSPSLLEKLEKAIGAVADFHEQLGAQVLRNLPPESGTTAPVISFQVPVEIQGETREFEFRYQPRNDKENAGTLDLRLELSNTGPMLISMQWDNPHLRIMIKVHTEEIVDVIEENTSELSRVLNQNGLQVIIHVTHGSMDDTILTNEDMLESIHTPGLDIRI